MQNARKFLWIEAVHKEGSFEHLNDFYDTFDTTVRKVVTPMGGRVSVSFSTSHDEVRDHIMPQKMVAVQINREQFPNSDEAGEQLHKMAQQLREKLAVRYFNISITLVTRTEDRETLYGNTAQELVPHDTRV
jgi:hypothetical protein